VECEAGYDPNSDSTECTKKDCSSLENCALCDTPEGATELECLQCKEDFLLDQRSTSTTRNTCIAAASCKGIAKPGVGEEGEQLGTCVDKACISVDQCASCDDTDESKCVTCKEGFLLDTRKDSGTTGLCVASSACTGLSGEDGEGHCIYLGCSEIPGCIACLASDPGQCGVCSDPNKSPSDDGLSCQPNTCLHGPPAVADCSKCEPLQNGDAGLACAACNAGYYLSTLTGDTQGSCLTRDDCRASGGMLGTSGDSGDSESVAVCLPMSCEDEHCDDCSGGASECQECKEGFLVDERTGGTSGTCISKEMCIGVFKEEGKTCVDKACVFDPNCAICDTTESQCAACKEGFLLDQRGGLSSGQCIQSTTCTGDLLKEESGKCVSKACSSIDRCATCGVPEFQCASCASGFHLDGSACIADDCHTKPDPVLNCDTCSESVATECKTCLPGYTLNTTAGTCEENDCASLANCSLCEFSEGPSEDSSELECIQCQDGYLVDQRDSSGSRGTCVSVETCTGVSRVDETARTCVDRGCAKVEHCRACEAGREEWCAQCEAGYALEESEGVQECREPPRSGVSGGAIAGIVVAVVVVVALIIFLCVWFLVCKKKNQGAVA